MKTPTGFASYLPRWPALTLSSEGPWEAISCELKTRDIFVPKRHISVVLTELTLGRDRVTKREGWAALEFIDATLPPDQRGSFWQDFRAAALEALSAGDACALADVLAGWEATAEIEANPREAQALWEDVQGFERGEHEPWEKVKQQLSGRSAE